MPFYYGQCVEHEQCSHNSWKNLKRCEAETGEECIAFMRRHLSRSTNHYGAYDGDPSDIIEDLLRKNPPEYATPEKWDKWYDDSGPKRRAAADDQEEERPSKKLIIDPAAPRPKSMPMPPKGSSSSSSSAAASSSSAAASSSRGDEVRITLPRSVVEHLCECSDKAAVAAKRASETSRSASVAFDEVQTSFDQVHKALIHALKQASKK